MPTILLADSNAISFMAVVGVVLGLNTLGIFGLIFHVGNYMGGLNEWRKSTDETLRENSTAIKLIHEQDIRQAKVDASLKTMETVTIQQDKVIHQLRKRTHDLRNVLTTANLIIPGTHLGGFEEVGGD